MKIKHKYINIMYELLYDLPLTGKNSRLRSRFCRELQKYFTEVVALEAEEIKNQFAVRDENGNVDYDENGGFRIQLGLLEEYKNEMSSFDNEYLELEYSDRNKEMLLIVADIILNNESIEVSGMIADAYDEICEEFESVIEYYSER